MSVLYTRELENAWEVLKPFVRVGEFTLRSGRKSDLYIDVKSAILSRGGVRITIALEKLLNEVQPPRNSTEFHYIGYGYGGAILCTAASSSFVHRQATLFRGEKKEYGLAKEPMGPKPRRTDTLVLLEDVVTTEGSIRECLIQMDYHPWVINKNRVIMSVVDRREDRLKRLDIFSLFNEDVIRALMKE